MANGHVEIHDPISNHNDLTSSTNCDPKSTSGTDSMGGTVELRLLMAYAKRRRPKKDAESTTRDSPISLNGATEANGSSSPQTPAKTEKEEEKKKRKGVKGLKSLQSLLICIRPKTRDEEPPQTIEGKCGVRDRSGGFKNDAVKEEDTLEEVVSKLAEIADDVPFTPPEVETDSPEDEVEKVIALLLRETGDRLNEKELKNAAIAAELFRDYSFFNRLITTLLTRMGLMTDPNAPVPQASPKTQIAVTCEVTSRLSAVDTLPMSRLLGYGARYLQDHYSSWVQQQGGYEEAFYSEDEDDDDE